MWFKLIKLEKIMSWPPVIILLFLILLPYSTYAEDIYQSPEAFIDEAFAGNPPKASILWINKELRPKVNKLMEHNYPVPRIKYWLKNKRSVWILEEIGKVKPITTGIIVEDGKIEFLKVLIYRESHGWEVKHAFFTDQFKDITLLNGKKLSRPIDNISGATMSVDALRNLTKLALFLHEEVMSEKKER